MLKLPYAIRDYHALITENYVYFDRTDRISILENRGKELITPNLVMQKLYFERLLWEEVIN